MVMRSFDLYLFFNPYHLDIAIALLIQLDAELYWTSLSVPCEPPALTR